MGFSVQSHRMVTKYATTSPTMPTTSNTGPRNTLTLSSGDTVLTTGQSVSNKHITGDLYMAGPSTTATDCQIDGAVLFNSAPGGNYGNPNPWTNQVVSYCHMGHIDSTGCDTITVDHCYIDGSLTGLGTLIAFLNSAGPPVKNITFTNNLVQNPQEWNGSSPPDPHLEAMHVSVCQTGLFQNNVFNWNAGTNTITKTTGVVNIDNPGGLDYPANPGSSNITFDGNWLFATGGGAQIYLFLSGSSFVTNNKFTTPPGTTQFSDIHSPTFHFTQSGNTLDGAPYTLPYS